MKLINNTQNKTIATNVIVKKGVGVVIGLIPYKVENKYIYDYLKWKKLDKNTAMWFKVRGKSGVHMWFMSFPISVFFLDKDGKVIEKVRLEPFERFRPKKNYECFIELSESWIKKISLGDKLELR